MLTPKFCTLKTLKPTQLMENTKRSCINTMNNFQDKARNVNTLALTRAGVFKIWELRLESDTNLSNVISY